MLITGQIEHYLIIITSILTSNLPYCVYNACNMYQECGQCDVYVFVSLTLDI